MMRDTIVCVERINGYYGVTFFTEKPCSPTEYVEADAAWEIWGAIDDVLDKITVFRDDSHAFDGLLEQVVPEWAHLLLESNGVIRCEYASDKGIVFASEEDQNDAVKLMRRVFSQHVVQDFLGRVAIEWGSMDQYWTIIPQRMQYAHMLPIRDWIKVRQWGWANGSFV